MAAELQKPGVVVEQKAQKPIPTIVTPTFVPCSLGVCRQIIELFTKSPAGDPIVNPDARVETPGGLVASPPSGTPAVYTTLDGGNLLFEVNEGATVTVRFFGNALSPASVVGAVNTELDQAGVTSARAFEVEALGTWELFTVGTGEHEEIEILSASSSEVLDAFEWSPGVQAGMRSYAGALTVLPRRAFPDPRGILDELVIEDDSVRVFLRSGTSSFVEARRDSAFLRRGHIAGVAETTSAPIGAGALAFVDQQTLIVVAGSITTEPETVTFSAPASVADVASQMSAAFSNVTVEVVGAGGDQIRIFAEDLPADQGLYIAPQSTAHVTLGFLAGIVGQGASIEALDDGNGDALTNLLKFGDGASAEDLVQPGTQAEITGVGGSFPLASTAVVTLGDFWVKRTVTLSGGIDLAGCITILNDAFGYPIASDAGGELRLTSDLAGTDAAIEVVSGDVSALGLSVGEARGVPDRVAPGDELFIDGRFFAKVTHVNPGGVDPSVIRIDKLVPIAPHVGSRFHVVARGLAPEMFGRPTPELLPGPAGTWALKPELLRGPYGEPLDAKGDVFIAYSALRLDVTARAKRPGLVKFSDPDTLEAALGPVTPENPLAFGLSLQMAAAPGIEHLGLGVDEVSPDAPDGTADAYARAARYLERFEVYALALLTHDDAAHEALVRHAAYMTEPQNKGERIVLFNPRMPRRRSDAVVASGGDGNKAGTHDFDTGNAELAQLVFERGIDTSGIIPVSAELFLDIESDARRYSISRVVGSSVTIRTSFGPDENSDAFFATTNLSDPSLPPLLVNEAFSIKLRGVELVTATGELDTSGIAEVIAEKGRGYGQETAWMIVPDRCTAPVGDLESVVAGYYACAAIAGDVCRQRSSQSFTTLPVVGLSGVIGSNDTFTDRELNVMAGGGAYILVQESEGAPVTTRMAITTDLSSFDSQTDSIVKALHYTRKFLRRGIRRFAGRYNMSEGYFDLLGTVVSGLGEFLVDQARVLRGFKLIEIGATDRRGETSVEVSVTVFDPSNWITVTIEI